MFIFLRLTGEATHVNAAYRIGDHVFSGDTSVRALLNPENEDAEELPGLSTGGRRRVLCLAFAQLWREDIRARIDEATNRRCFSLSDAIRLRYAGRLNSQRNLP